MSFWSLLARGVELAARLRVPDRRGQVWQEMVSYRGVKSLAPALATYAVVSAPFPAHDGTLDRLLSGSPVWTRAGWLHRTLNLETGKHAVVNEAWLTVWSERNVARDDGVVWTRLV